MPSKSINPYLPLLAAIHDLPTSNIRTYAIQVHSTVHRVRQQLALLVKWQLVVYTPKSRYHKYRLATLEEHHTCEQCGQAITPFQAMIYFAARRGQFYLRRSCADCRHRYRRQIEAQWESANPEQNQARTRRYRVRKAIRNVNRNSRTLRRT